MANIRIASVSEPFTEHGALQAGIDLVRRAASLGIASSAGERALDLALVREIAREASMLGVGSAAAQALLAADPGGAGSGVEFETLVRSLRDALMDSALPDLELRELSGVFDGESLGSLLGISAASLRRYVSRERSVPDPVAERIHWLSLVVSDLLGAYNAFGVRRWFARPRTQLDGLSPATSLEPDWTPENPSARRVAALAASLVGGGAPGAASGGGASSGLPGGAGRGSPGGAPA